jgi:hypothetical protein
MTLIKEILDAAVGISKESLQAINEWLQSAIGFVVWLFIPLIMIAGAIAILYCVVIFLRAIIMSHIEWNNASDEKRARLVEQRKSHPRTFGRPVRGMDAPDDSGSPSGMSGV